MRAPSRNDLASSPSSLTSSDVSAVVVRCWASCTCTRFRFPAKSAANVREIARLIAITDGIARTCPLVACFDFDRSALPRVTASAARPLGWWRRCDCAGSTLAWSVGAGERSARVGFTGCNRNHAARAVGGGAVLDIQVGAIVREADGSRVLVLGFTGTAVVDRCVGVGDLTQGSAEQVVSTSDNAGHCRPPCEGSGRFRRLALLVLLALIRSAAAPANAGKHTVNE